jgi:hypothetical protein
MSKQYKQSVGVLGVGLALFVLGAMTLEVEVERHGVLHWAGAHGFLQEGSGLGGKGV